MQSKDKDTRPARIETSGLNNYQKIQAYLLRKPGAEELTGKALDQFKRYRQANQLLCEFHTKEEVANELASLFGISMATAYKDIRESTRLFGEATESAKQGLIHQLSEMKMKIAKKAYDKGEFETALKAVNGIGKINGLDKEESQAFDPDDIKPAVIVISTDAKDLVAEANKMIEDVEDAELLEEGDYYEQD